MTTINQAELYLIIGIGAVLVTVIIFLALRMQGLEKDLDFFSTRSRGLEFRLDESAKELDMYKRNCKDLYDTNCEQDKEVKYYKQILDHYIEKDVWHPMTELPPEDELVLVKRRMLGGELHFCGAEYDTKKNEWKFEKPWALHAEGWCYLPDEETTEKEDSSKETSSIKEMLKQS